MKKIKHFFFKKKKAHLAMFVAQAWEDEPCKEKFQQLYCMMNNLLNTTNIDSDEPFEILLQKYCCSSSSIPTLCPSITLLIAISYIERLHRVNQ